LWQQQQHKCVEATAVSQHFPLSFDVLSSANTKAFG